MELELGLGLGLALPNTHPLALAGGGGEFVGLLSGACGEKRVFGDAFVPAAKATLPLFVRDDGGGDGGRGGDDRDGVEDDEPSNKKKRLVGWPPVKCALRRSCGGSGYVKVKMEGVAIGRKVDVSLHGSYQDLLRTLQRMFPASAANQHGAGADADRRAEEEEEVASDERRRGGHPYVVTYEDGEGDWLLVGDDVPWEVFVKTVKRLKILA